MRVLNAQLNVDARKSAKGSTYFVYSVNVLDEKGNIKEIIPIPMDAVNSITSKKLVELAAHCGQHVDEKVTEVNIETW